NSPSASSPPGRTSIRIRLPGSRRPASSPPTTPGSSGSGCCRSRSCSRSRRWPSRSPTYRRGQADCEAPLPMFKNDRVGAYTLVHCTDDPEEATRYGLWDSVKWWYQNLAEFTLEWELAHLPEAEKAQVFPLLEPTMRGDIDLRSYTEQDMIIVGTP